MNSKSLVLAALVLAACATTPEIRGFATVLKGGIVGATTLEACEKARHQLDGPPCGDIVVRPASQADARWWLARGRLSGEPVFIMLPTAAACSESAKRFGGTCYPARIMPSDP